MTDVTIPDAAVEAAASAHRASHTNKTNAWEPLPENIKAMWREEVLDALYRAAPYIAAQALRDAAAEVDGCAYTPDDVREVAHGSDYADGITDAHHAFDRLLNARADRIEADHG